MWHTYILYSAKIDHYYIGYTENLSTCLENHLAGGSRFTSRADDWKLVYQEEYAVKFDDIKREREIKRMKSRRCIEAMVVARGRPD